MTSVSASWTVARLNIDIERGMLVGILNVTPDSFSDGGLHFDTAAAVSHGFDLVSDGARIVDVGGESTRPGAEPVSVEEEMRRALPVVSELARRGVAVSIDTRKPDVAAAALEAGAGVVNDVTGFASPQMVDVVSDSDCGVVITHGRDSHLDAMPDDVDALGEVERYLTQKAEELTDAGVNPRRIVIDPGIGFAKKAEQSLTLLAGVRRLAAHGFPVLVGTSRKGFLAKVTGSTDRDALDDATAATTALTYLLGARVFRVHNVAKSRDALRVAAAIVAGE